MRRTLIMAATAAVIVLGAAGARAESRGHACTSAAPDKYLAAAELQAKVEAQGYTVNRVKIASTCGEVYAFDKSGAKVELYVDPTDGTIVRTDTD